MFGLVYTPWSYGSGMATAKTGSFYLTETVTLPAALPNGTRVTGTIDLGAYVNAPTGQAIAIDMVDFITQRGTDFGGDVGAFLGGNNGAVTKQLTDLNPGAAFVRADNQSLIASGSLNIDGPNNIASEGVDLYPDSFGGASLSESFMVVNDTLYLTCGNDGFAVGAQDLSVTARIRCRVVKLGTKDWIALALQSTASDN